MNLLPKPGAAIRLSVFAATALALATVFPVRAAVVAHDSWTDGSRLTVSATNKLAIARTAQTLELSAQDLRPLGETNLNRIHVWDAAGAEVLCQAVDTDCDPLHAPDIVIFQADFAPGEVKQFTVGSGKVQEYHKTDFKAYGRFVRERFDDFAWENDRIAHRTYGKALETWKGEPLTSSTIDIWSKRTNRMVIDDWYMTAHYHMDTGEGLDDYSAGTSRGCGGTGLWADNRLWVSKNFVDSRVLASGPLRVLFELVYEPFEVNGTKVSEVKRITLDAGSQLDHYQSFYRPQGAATPLTAAIGFKKVSGAEKQFNSDHGWLTVWEPMAKNQGMQGLAAIVDPKTIQGQTEDKLNHLLLVKVPPDNVVSYWAGFAWDRAGRIPSAEAWKNYIDQFVEQLNSPIAVGVSSR
jgi:hypothetical protein